MGVPLAGDLVRVRADVEGDEPLARQCAAHRVDRGMRRERLRRGTQCGVKAAPMLREHRRVPLVGGRRHRVEPRQRGIEIAADLMNQLDRGRDVHGLDIDLQQRPIADPGFVFHLDRVVAETDDEIGGAQELALDLPAGPLDAAERERMILVDHALGHGRGGERQVVAFDDVAQHLRIGDAHRRGAEDRNRPLGRGDQLCRAGERGVGRGRELSRLRRRREPFVGGGERDVLR